MSKSAFYSIADLVQAGIVSNSSKENSRTAYMKDMQRFFNWGGMIPSTEKQIQLYLLAHCESHKPSTLHRWRASICLAHRLAGFDDIPTSAKVVKNTLSDIKWSNSSAQRQATPVDAALLNAMIDDLDDTLSGVRNRSLLLLAFYGALNRARITGIYVEDIKFQRKGVFIGLRSSEEGSALNDVMWIPKNEKDRGHCPVAALKTWLDSGKILAGPVFRAINKNGRVSGRKISDIVVSTIVKESLARIGVDSRFFSSQSMRYGFIVSAVHDRVPYDEIKAQARYRSDMVLTAQLAKVWRIKTENAS